MSFGQIVLHPLKHFLSLFLYRVPLEKKMLIHMIGNEHFLHDGQGQCYRYATLVKGNHSWIVVEAPLEYKVSCHNNVVVSIL